MSASTTSAASGACKPSCPALEAAAPSHVVNVVSVAGVVAFPPPGPYSASKHAQLAFSRTVAAELRSRGIRVHTVKPGFAETEGFPQKWLPEADAAVRHRAGEVADHIVRSLEHGRGETTVPRYYALGGIVQDMLPECLRAVLGRSRKL